MNKERAENILASIWNQIRELKSKHYRVEKTIVSISDMRCLLMYHEDLLGVYIDPEGEKRVFGYLIEDSKSVQDGDPDVIPVTNIPTEVFLKSKK